MKNPITDEMGEVYINCEWCAAEEAIYKVRLDTHFDWVLICHHCYHLIPPKSEPGLTEI